MDLNWKLFTLVLSGLILLSSPTFAAFENVATGKSAHTGRDGYRATDPVDGNTVSNKYEVCVQTANAIPDSWWEVDLTKPYFIHQVKIYFRTGLTTRRNGVHVYVSSTARQINKGHLCGVVTGRKDGSDIPDVTDITCDYTARYVTLYQETDNGYGVIMDFCEVQVYACEVNVKYGSNCDQLCSQRHCHSTSTSSCDVHSGSCDAGCEAGWQGVDCKQTCSQSVDYGINCTNLCKDRHCADSSASCNRQTGNCGSGGCQPGWKKPDCSQECEQNVRYGSNCNKYCSSRHCVSSSSCDVKTGDCGTERCLPGWEGQDCTQACDMNIKYGSNCEKSCSERQCADTTLSCDVHTGACNRGCKPGWKGVDCMQECQRGFAYGFNCEKRCAERHCLKNSPCDSKTGTCVGGCQPGWRETDCSKPCLQGMYDVNCSKICTERHCNGPSNCPHTNGQCENGCEITWKGVDCTECDGTYGVECNIPCSDRHCKEDNSSCDSQTGECVGGCKPGWMDSPCTQKCSVGEYGEGCLQECIDRHCYGGQRCHFQTGQCVDGCIAGWQGVSCNRASPHDDTDTKFIVLSTFTGILALVVLILVIIFIRKVLMVRKRPKSSVPSVSFEKPNERNQTRMTTSPSSVYEVVADDVNVSSPGEQSASQVGGRNTTEHDYKNEAYSTENNEQGTHDYDRMELDNVEQTPYEKIRM